MTVNLKAIMLKYRIDKSKVAQWLFSEMPPEAGQRKVDRIARGEQTLNADELLVLSAYLVETPNDLYDADLITAVKEAKMKRQALAIEQALQNKRVLTQKTQINESN